MELSFLHLVVFLCTLVCIVRADHDAVSYLQGKTPRMDPKRVAFHHRIVWIGLMLMIVTGVLLMRPLWEFYITDPVFIAKMVFVLGLIVNSFFIGSLSRIATEKPFLELTRKEKLPLFISGLVSVVCWAGSFVLGFFFL